MKTALFLATRLSCKDETEDVYRLSLAAQQFEENYDRREVNDVHRLFQVIKEAAAHLFQRSSWLDHDVVSIGSAKLRDVVVNLWPLDFFLKEDTLLDVSSPLPTPLH